MEAIRLEANFFLVSILCGILLLFIYDGIRIFRRLIPQGKVMVAFEDLLFWFLASFLIFRMMYIQNSGILRGFSIMGMGMGMLFYHFKLSDFLVNGFTAILQKIIYILSKIIKVILLPFGWILKRFQWIGIGMRKIIKRILKYCVKFLKKSWKRVKIINTKR